MTMRTDRRALLAGTGAALLAAPRAVRAQAGPPLEIITSDIRPLSIPPSTTPGDARRGIVLDIVAEAVRAIGREPRFTFLTFPETVTRATNVPGTLVAPLGRVPSREALFTWVAKVVDVPQALGTLVDRPVADLAAARAMARVGVVRGGLQEAFLREQGLTNLVVIETGRELATALSEGRVDAWYSSAPEIAQQFEAIGQPGRARFGPALQTAPAWLAAHKDPGDAPVAALREAIGRLEADGSAERAYRAYVPG